MVTAFTDWIAAPGCDWRPQGRVPAKKVANRFLVWEDGKTIAIVVMIDSQSWNLTLVRHPGRKNPGVLRNRTRNPFWKDRQPFAVIQPVIFVEEFD